MMSFSLSAGAIVAGIALSVLSNGCGGSAVPVDELTGCRHEIQGVASVIRPETSKLNCAAISDLVFSIPSKPEKYLIESDSSRLFWKCAYFGTDQSSVLLRCELDKRRFSIVKSAE
jgi:hypothetical protein